MRITCKNCGGDHPIWDCKRPATKSGFSLSAESAKPKSDTLGKVASRAKSTAARKDVPTSKAGYQATLQVAKASSDEEGLDARAGTQALPVDTNSTSSSGDFPPFTPSLELQASFAGTDGDADRQPKFDKKAWQREYMRDHRKGIRRRANVH